MNRRQVNEDYFDNLYEMMCGKRFSRDISYRKLFSFLHSVDFRWSIPNDVNRAEDGEGLRWRYAKIREDRNYILECLDRPCSVLEMMIALAIRCEENIMDDPRMGDRTTQWFWQMIVNLGLGSMQDERFDEDIARDAVERMLNRDFEPDGRGGLFTVRRCDRDLRNVEFIHQLYYYLNSIT